MTRWILGRLLGTLVLAVGVATLVFLLMDIAPGDPASLLLRPGMDPAVADRIRASWGLDQALPVRYVRWLGALATLDLGWSFSHGRPVTEVIAAALPDTLLLSGAALAGAFAVGVTVGVVQALRRGSLADTAMGAVSLFFYSIPSFWLGLMLILVFSLLAGTVWDWPVHFPASGTRSVDHALLSPAARVLDRAWHLALPAATLVLVLAGGIARFARASMVEALEADHVRAARARGLPERRVVWNHAFRNAVIPVISLLGLYIPLLLGGAVLVESVFAWPGMGRLLVQAIGARDYPVVVSGSFCFAAVVVVGNLVADVLYRVVDPRIRPREHHG